MFARLDKSFMLFFVIASSAKPNKLIASNGTRFAHLLDSHSPKRRRSARYQDVADLLRRRPLKDLEFQGLLIVWLAALVAERDVFANESKSLLALLLGGRQIRVPVVDCVPVERECAPLSLVFGVVVGDGVNVVAGYVLIFGEMFGGSVSDDVGLRLEAVVGGGVFGHVERCGVFKMLRYW